MLDIFLKRNIDSGLKQLEKRQHVFLRFEQIQSVLILFDIHYWNSVVPVVEDLKLNGKQVLLWTILHKSDKGQSAIPHFTEKVRVVDLHTDLNWKKVLRPEVLDEFSALRYDTLLDLSSDDNDYMTLLRIRNNGRFNLGFRELDYKIFDFIFLKGEDQTTFEAYEQMKIYMNHIQ